MQLSDAIREKVNNLIKERNVNIWYICKNTSISCSTMTTFLYTYWIHIFQIMRDFYRVLEHFIKNEKIRRMLVNKHSSTIFIGIEKVKKMLGVTAAIIEI